MAARPDQQYGSRRAVHSGAGRLSNPSRKANSADGGRRCPGTRIL